MIVHFNYVEHHNMYKMSLSIRQMEEDLHPIVDQYQVCSILLPIDNGVADSVNIK